MAPLPPPLSRGLNRQTPKICRGGGGVALFAPPPSLREPLFRLSAQAQVCAVCPQPAHNTNTRIYKQTVGVIAETPLKKPSQFKFNDIILVKTPFFIQVREVYVTCSSQK